jgi:site-specific recombinase XerD
MPIRPEQARALLPRVDPGRQRSDGWPVGLRDGALLALLAVGLTSAELATLRASSISMARGKVLVGVKRHSTNWFTILPPDLGGHLLAWLSERRVWATPEPVFTSPQGPLSVEGIYTIVKRYRHKRSARKC